MKHFVTHRGGGQPYCLTKNYPHFSKQPGLLKIFFSSALAFVLSLFCFPQVSKLGQDLNAPSNAFTYNDTSFSKIDEIYNGDGTFNKTNFEKLLQQTSGISTLTSANLSELNTKVTSANITASDMRSFTTGGKSSGKDIVVRMGGLDWTPTYLSKTKTGDPILTLWLSNNEQDAFQTRTNNAAEGAFYGYVKSTTTNRYGLYSDWSADWFSNTTSQGTAAFYPSAMYGMSYIRSVTLNNGGQYATSNTALAADPGQKTTSIFAPFTMSSNPLSSFIATPSEVSWQEKQSATATNGTSSSYDYPNDEWHPDSAQGKYYSDAYNYVEHNGYDTWKNDKLWLPSMAETGYSTSKLGLWNPSVAQRANYDGSSTSFTATIGTSENKNNATTAYTYSWLRSGFSNNACYAYYLLPSGSAHSHDGVRSARAVRPALHLNLTKAAQNVDFFDDYPGIYKASDGSYHITDYTGLKAMSDFTNADGEFKATDKFYLDKSIDCTDKSFDPIKSFTGTLDGQGNSIINLNISSDTVTNKELTEYCFIHTATDATIQNINFIGNNIIGGGNNASFIYEASNKVTLFRLFRLGGSTKMSVGPGTICSGLIGIAQSESEIEISHCEVVGNTLERGNNHPAGFIALAQAKTIKIIDSCYRGAIREQPTNMGAARTIWRLVDVGATGTVTYSGVYSQSGKRYWAGFSDTEWICSDDMQSGYPMLKWNLWVGENLPQTSVEEWLVAKGFSLVT